MRYGYFSNLSADQIAYATQSSEGAFIVSKERKDEVAVEILLENFHHCDEKMYVAIKDEDILTLSKIISKPIPRSPKELKNLSIEFEVRHVYFDSLIKAINRIEDNIIARIMPSFQDFLPFPSHHSSDFDHDQLQALSTILSSDSRSPPVIVNGPFGTGKTRMLAIAARCLVEQGRSSNKPVRVLICTHHQSSADYYIEEYFGPMCINEHDPWDVKLVRLTSNSYIRNSKFSQYYKRRNQGSDYWRSLRYFVMVTTFLTVPSHYEAGFFTHILLDEGSQTREPENITPLCLAAPDTKIVLAGDSCQVS